MKEAVIVEAVRTPMGRHSGILKDIRTDDLAAHIIAKLVEKTGINKEEIEDVYFGCTNQAGEDSRNVARNASLLAGLPYTIPGATVNRLVAQVAYEGVFLAINDQPISFRVAAQGTTQNDFDRDVRAVELRFTAGLRMSFWAPPRVFEPMPAFEEP